MSADARGAPQDTERELTRGQMLIWTGQCLQADDPLYNMVIVFRIRGALDEQRFQAAFEALLATTDSLRAVIVGDDDSPRQRFPASVESRLQLVDLGDAPGAGNRLRDWVAGRCRRTLDLRVCSYDSALLRLADDDHAWYLNQHHLYTDAWTKAVLFRRLGEYYAAAGAGRLGDLPRPPQFEAHVEQQQRERDSPRLARASAYWQTALPARPAPSRFYAPTPATRSARTARLAFDLGTTRSARLRALAESPAHRALTTDLALFRLFATALVALLHRLGGQRELAIGTPSLNRPTAALKDTAGLFIELFPLRVRVDEQPSFRSLFDSVARESQTLLLNAVPGACGLEQGRSYDVVLNYITASFGTFDGLPVESQWVHPDHGDRNHLLRLQVQDFDRRSAFSLLFDINEDVCTEEERGWLVEHFTRLLDALIEDAGQRIDRVPLSSDAQQAAEIAALRGPRRDPPRETVDEMFRERARLNPDAVALVAGRGPATGTHREQADPCRARLSYRELDEAAARVAAQLHARGIGRGDVVAVALPRSIEAVLAIFGVMRSGAAYVPIDPCHPGDRIAYVLAHCGARLVVTAGAESRVPGSDGPPTVPIDTLLDGPQPPQALPAARLDDLAYVLYTSGSTGRPKGVAVGHASLANYIGWAARQYCEGGTPTFALFTPLTFDLTVTSLFAPLSVGGTLVVYAEPAEGREITVRRVVEDNRVEVIKLTPAHLALIQDMDLSGSRLRVLVVGGEDFKTALAQSVHQRLGGRAAIYNEYGPTEATVACMIYRHDPRRDTGASVPIGTAIDNLEIYLLDAHGRPVPRGTVGEIVIGGAGVARGYLGEAGDTAATRSTKFLDNPFRPGELMYRSGDRGYRDRDGVAHYLGRSDTQLKVRGVRIETAEVEAALLAHPDIDECVVDLVRMQPAAPFCRQCGLDSRHPEADIDSQGVCRLCRGFASDQSPARSYFGDNAELARIVAGIRERAPAPPHCLMLLSGGKDSTYALCRIVEMGLQPLVFTLDNGYISEGAKANIRRVVDKLGLELVVGSTPAMNEIFRDSLERFSNVCNGCFKTIYTLSMKLARERGIRHIVTGLSRGQIFETRMAGLFQQRVTDRESIDRTIIEARKAYHRIDDAVARCLDVSMFADDAVFEEIEFVDFYRYSDASLADIYDYLAREAPWIRPADTGRSTNCLINDVGIHVHKTERGYHNYSLPYSWDVRLGHKQRDAARQELDDRIDTARVERILGEIGYRPVAGVFDTGAEERLAAWFVAENPPSPETLRQWMTSRLPAEFVPSHFVALPALPLTANGKVDRNALPAPTQADTLAERPYAAPASAAEEVLAAIWSDVLNVARVGVDQNFFDLGGDSILSIQIVARARAAGVAITPQQIFDHPTVSELAAAAGARTRIEAEQGPVRGRSPATPIQQRFLEQHADDLDRHAQVALLALPPGADRDAVRSAVTAVWNHHDALRSRFARDGEGRWEQVFGDDAAPPDLLEVDAAESPAETLASDIAQSMLGALDIGGGRLLQAALLHDGDGGERLLLVAHPLVVDALSWWVMLEDLDLLLSARGAGGAGAMPAKTTSFRHWALALGRRARSARVLRQSEYWTQPLVCPAFLQQRATATGTTPGGRAVLNVRLGETQTRRLVQDAAAALRAQLPDLLAAALLEASHRCTGDDALGVSIEVHGREDIEPGLDLLRTVGALTSVHPLRLTRPRTSRPLEVLRAVKEQLRAVPDRGLGYGLLRYTDGDPATARRLAGQPPTPVTLSYMGQWDRSQADEVRFCRPVRSVGGEGRSASALEVEAVVFAGVLDVEFRYLTDVCDARTVQEFARCFREALEAYTGHGAEAVETALSPSDFPQAGIGQDELDEILSEFGEKP